jgi:hypothetical protein
MSNRLVRIAFFATLAAAGPTVHAGEAPAPAAKPRVIALVAAAGTRFHVAIEGKITGSRLDNYNRRAHEASEDVLNRIVLGALDKELAERQPGAKRVYLSMPAPRLETVSASERDEHAIRKVIESLEAMPQRAEWDRIVVATPAWKAFDTSGLADRLQGMGLSVHPMDSGLSMFFNLPASVDSMRGDDALTPEGKQARSVIYVAPYAYLTIWILDPKTLAVLDRQDRFDSRKLANPGSGTSDLIEGIGREFIAKQIVAVIGRSVHEAIGRSELAGKVEVHEVREVKPPQAGATSAP